MLIAGLGLETARQLALRPDYVRIFVSVRSPNKAGSAIAHLVEQTGVSADRFEPVLFDLLDTDSIAQAVEVLASRGVHLDGSLLNAGGMSTPVGGKLPLASSRNTRSFDRNVGGHARLVNEVLDRGVLSSGDTGRLAIRRLDFAFGGDAQDADPPLRHSHRATKVITPASNATRSHCLGTVPSTIRPSRRAASAPVIK
ncbi:MAG: SDR family NAD(P)-dependent oxidoreductase [Deltaproteobacteria bacterium]|nr:SDR family NAD(P)-dependent oxidoreductase [Deltaproteobacteria bacterium]